MRLLGGSCANALTTWTPTMFSSATVATSAMLLLHVAQDRVRDVAVPVGERRRAGVIASATSASRQSTTNMTA